MYTKIRTCNNNKNQRNFTARIVNILKRKLFHNQSHMCVYIIELSHKLNDLNYR